jgi:hypothetical protein
MARQIAAAAFLAQRVENDELLGFLCIRCADAGLFSPIPIEIGEAKLRVIITVGLLLGAPVPRPSAFSVAAF